MGLLEYGGRKKILFLAKPSYSICSTNGGRDVCIHVPPPPFFISEDKAVVKNSPPCPVCFLKMAFQYNVLHAWFHFSAHEEKRIIYTSHQLSFLFFFNAFHMLEWTLPPSGSSSNLPETRACTFFMEWKTLYLTGLAHTQGNNHTPIYRFSNYI